jgi:malto-oligosyltrehalose trehalohydrolase/4-alpha-glucanotransferase
VTRISARIPDNDSRTGRPARTRRPLTRFHHMKFGAEPREDGSIRFRLWAPSHAQIGLQLDGEAKSRAMRRTRNGWHELTTDRARPGTRYWFILPDGSRVSDPASRHQPSDVHGPSEVIDPRSYVWGDEKWRGRPWEEAVIYELHIGAFTPAGTFHAAVDKLDHLVALGVTAIEIMPVADFPGARNWGYDGVLPFAPDGSYGRPEDLKFLVDACHARGMMALLDVVYNHFGPDGAYLHAIAPEMFTDRHKTPWGAAIDLDGPHSETVREFFIQNALYWLEEFHFDGLRLDAVHAIFDDSPRHFLVELAERVRAAKADRHVHLILENEENAARLLRRHEGGPEGLSEGDVLPLFYTAQWNDDAHHVLHVAATGDAQGYYADYLGDTGKLGRALAEGFAFQGEMMPYRGHNRGEPSASLPPTAFVAFIQNHDQIGNRPFGDRLTAIASVGSVRAVAAVYLLLPQVPMLFMGEEWAAAQPFPFFCDFGPELAEAVRNGRRDEFARFPAFRDPATRERIPDATAEETFAAAKLAWDDVVRTPHAQWLDFYGRLLAVRHAEIVPILSLVRSGGRYEVIGDGAVSVAWSIGESGASLMLDANLSDRSVTGFARSTGRVLWREGEQHDDGGTFGAWAVRWSLREQTKASDSALDRLAEKVGIEPRFRDVRGDVVVTSTDTKRVLLAAMGLPAANEAEARAALEQLERYEWLSPLPPVAVVRGDSEQPAVELVLPAATSTPVTWRLALEDGAERGGCVEFRELERLAAHLFDDQPLERRRLLLPNGLPCGYHRLTIEPGNAATTIVVTPGHCWLPDVLRDGGRLWGIAAQLYLLRSESNWGIGDFTDLRELVRLAASRGASVVGLNPLHALFPDNPEHASPYSPASRLLLNILNIDVTALPESRDCPDVAELIRALHDRIEQCRARHLVDYKTVAELKFEVLRKLFDACRADTRRWRAYQAFRRDAGDILERSCLFLALREHFAARSPELADWHAWPEDYRQPDAPSVARFRETHGERVEFLAWAQFVADEQLGAAAALARRHGMPIGLYRDLAIGADGSGAETWTNAAAVVSGARVGAPPDIGNPSGQDWGLPPFHPVRLRNEAYRGFIELIRANMRHAGGLRIDHVMGLRQLWWVPTGHAPRDGAYVRNPMDDLIGILALESQRNRCLVVGEDLGTVPEGFREQLAAANVLSYRVLSFEQNPETRVFLPPADYPRLALAVVGSHDLPTLRGWWDGVDLDLKQDLHLFPGGNEEAAEQRRLRQRDRSRLLEALRAEGLITSVTEPEFQHLAEAVHAFLARTPSMLAMVQIDDLTGESEPVNLPTTSTEHPNWRRRLRMTLRELEQRAELNNVAKISNEERRPRESREAGNA